MNFRERDQMLIPPADWRLERHQHVALPADPASVFSGKGGRSLPDEGSDRATT